jgi:hypothetical protein
VNVAKVMLLVGAAALVVVGARLRGRPLTARVRRQATTLRGLICSLLCINGTLSGDSLVTKLSIGALVIIVVGSAYELRRLNPR